MRRGLPAAHRPNSAPAYYLGHPARLWITVMRRTALRRYARQAGFRDLEVLPVEAEMLRFYRLTP